MSAKKKARNTPWQPHLWQRVYRGRTIWVEEVYNHAPSWVWTESDSPFFDEEERRVRTRKRAQKAAEAHVDELIALEKKGNR